MKKARRILVETFILKKSYENPNNPRKKKNRIDMALECVFTDVDSFQGVSNVLSIFLSHSRQETFA